MHLTMLGVLFRNGIQILADQRQQFATWRPVEGIIRVAGWGRIQNDIFIFTRMTNLHCMVHIDEVDRPGDVYFVRHADVFQDRGFEMSMREGSLRDTSIQQSLRLGEGKRNSNQIHAMMYLLY